MMKNKEELKQMFATGKIPTGGDFSELIDGVVGEKGAKGDTGERGPIGPQGSNGLDADESKIEDLLNRVKELEKKMAE